MIIRDKRNPLSTLPNSRHKEKRYTQGSLLDLCQRSIAATLYDVTALYVFLKPDNRSNGPLKSGRVFRVEVCNGVKVAIAERPVFGCQFTLSSALPARKELSLQPGDVLGWASHNWRDLIRMVSYYPDHQRCTTSIASLFDAEDGCFRSLAPLSVYVIGDTPDTLLRYGLFFVRPSG